MVAELPDSEIAPGAPARATQLKPCTAPVLLASLLRRRRLHPTDLIKIKLRNICAETALRVSYKAVAATSKSG